MSLRWTAACLPVLVSACLSQHTHPLRVTHGPTSEQAVGFAKTSDRDDGECVQGDCETPDRTTTMGNPYRASIGYGHVFRGNFGAMLGIQFPATVSEDWHKMVGVYSFFTVQNDYASVGVGPSISGDGLTFTAGGTIRPPSPATSPELGLFFRRFIPFDEELRLGGLKPTWEVGARFRLAMWYVQQTYRRQDYGVFDFGGDTAWGRAAHLTSMGVQIDRDTVPGLIEHSPYYAYLPFIPAAVAMLAYGFAVLR